MFVSSVKIVDFVLTVEEVNMKYLIEFIIQKKKNL